MGGMENTDNVSMEEKILERLKNADERDNIIMDLCQEKKINWSEAQAIVERIEAQKSNQIVLAQSPVLVLMALGIFIGGVALSTQAVGGMVLVYSIFSNSALPSEIPMNFLGFSMYAVSYAPGLLASFVLGLGMMIGSLKGMEDVWRAIFEKVGLFNTSEE
jgi:hypothetical protein